MDSAAWGGRHPGAPTGPLTVSGLAQTIISAAPLNLPGSSVSTLPAEALESKELLDEVVQDDDEDKTQ